MYGLLRRFAPRNDDFVRQWQSSARWTQAKAGDARWRITRSSASPIQSELQKLPGWSVKNGNIEAAFEFATFRDAIAFIVQIAIEAEVMNHHPEFHNSYNRVSFSFCTHDAGHKITDLDIETASRISAAARRFQSMR